MRVDEDEKPLIVPAVKRSKMIAQTLPSACWVGPGVRWHAGRPQRWEGPGAHLRAINGRFFVRLGRWIDGHTVNTEKSQWSTRVNTRRDATIILPRQPPRTLRFTDHEHSGQLAVCNSVNWSAAYSFYIYT